MFPHLCEADSATHAVFLSFFPTCLDAKMRELGLLLGGEFFSKVAFNQWNCRSELREHLSIVQDRDRSLEVREFYYYDYTTYRFIMTPLK